MIADCRIINRHVRYCDTAAGDISVLSGEIFYVPVGASIAQRDEGIARAVAWLKSNKLL